MATTGLINRYAAAMLSSARRHGFDEGTIRRAAGMPPRPRPDHIFTPEDYARLSLHVRLIMQDEFCGVTQTPCRIGVFAMMCRLVAAHRTLGEGLAAGFELYGHVTKDVAFDLREEGGIARLRVRLARPELDPDHLLHEWWLQVWAALASWLLGEKMVRLSVDLPYALNGDLAEYEEAFSPRCRFSQPDAVASFDRRLLDRRIVRGPLDIHKWHEVTRIDLVTWPGAEFSFPSLVKIKMQAHLQQKERFLTLKQMAREFDVSPQTLRRRLEGEGASFRQVKEEVRRDAVIAWLRQPDLAIGEISLRSGFADQNGLFRAMRSWVGMTPGEYRDLILRHGDGGPPADIEHQAARAGR